MESIKYTRGLVEEPTLTQSTCTLPGCPIDDSPFRANESRYWQKRSFESDDTFQITNKRQRTSYDRDSIPPTDPRTKVWLTKWSLTEIERRNRVLTSPKPTGPTKQQILRMVLADLMGGKNFPETGHELMSVFEPNEVVDLKLLASSGGPNLSSVRGYYERPPLSHRRDPMTTSAPQTSTEYKNQHTRCPKHSASGVDRTRSSKGERKSSH